MPQSEPFHSHRILPVGTQVVTLKPGNGGESSVPEGSVGVVSEVSAGEPRVYRVRFPDGGTARFCRGDLAILKQHQREGIFEPEPPGSDSPLFKCVIYRCVVGSRAYGLEDEGSDLDLRGIYLPPADLHWSLWGAPEQLERPETEEVYWELRKFLILALKANPNILECLYTPLIERTTPLADELIGMREIFLSKRVYQTYNGYVMSQFKKLQADLRNRGEIKWKHAMHLIRLLLAGVTAVREGIIPVRVEDHREQLLEIKRGGVPWEEVNRWRLALHEEFEAAFRDSTLPERPDAERANDFLIRARRSMIDL